MFSSETFAMQLCWILTFIPLVSGIDLFEFGLPLGFRPAENTRQDFDQNTIISRTRGSFRGSTTQSIRATSSARAESSFQPPSSTRAIVTSQIIQISSSPTTTRTTLVASNTVAMGTIPSSVTIPTSSAILPVTTWSAIRPVTTPLQAAPTVPTTSLSVVTPTSSAIQLQNTDQQPSGQSALAPSPVPRQVGLPDSVPFPASDREGLSPMSQLGVSFGVTFGILAIAAGVAIWIWYKRRHPRIKVGTDDPKEIGGLSKSSPSAAVTGYFKRKKNKDTNDDQEWSIESAERVSIVKNMQAQSVSTVTRSNSSNSTRLAEDDGTKTMKEGRTNGLALNPITPKSAVFPMPPSHADVEKMQEKPVEQKPSEWPLNR